jgi:hypothetical protein
MVPHRHLGKMRGRITMTGIPAYRDIPIAYTGTHLTTPTEAEVIAGTQTIIITLTGAIWAASGATFNAQRQNIIDGLSSRQSEATGWNTLVRDEMAVTDVARTSDTAVTITLPATPTYRVSANEEIVFALPATAVAGGAGKAGFSHTVVASNPVVTAALTGSFLTTPTEGEVVTGSQTIIITLTGGTWVADGATFEAQRQAIIDGLVSDGAEAAGWNVEVRDEMAVTTVVRTSDTAVTVTLPATAAYAIDDAEIVTVTIPAAAVDLVTAAIVATETITIEPD